jgi:DNA-binding NarL/FixJ family response regulator
MKIKVALVEDHHIVREGLVSIISKIPKVEFVFSAENGQDFFNKLVQHSIDLVFLDLEMPIMDGIQTFRLLKENHPEIKSIMLTMHNDNDVAMELIKEGVSAYLLKSSTIQEITSAIYQVNEKGRFMSEFAEDLLYNQLHKKTESKHNPKGFTDRELAIIRFICDGLTSKEIGSRLSLAKKTIDNARINILKAYDVKSANELIRLCILDDIYTPRTNKEIIDELEDHKQAVYLRRITRLT